jgi:hypothetical protein
VAGNKFIRLLTPASKPPRAFELTKIYEQLEHEMKLVQLYRLLSGTRLGYFVRVPPLGAPVYKYVAFAGAEILTDVQVYNFDRRVAL